MITYAMLVVLDIFKTGSFKASSSSKSNVRESSASLKHKTGWCPDMSRGPHWIQVDMGKKIEITKVGTKGYQGKQRARYVSKYTLSVSNNGQSWETVKENGIKKVLEIKIFTRVTIRTPCHFELFRP